MSSSSWSDMFCGAGIAMYRTFAESSESSTPRTFELCIQPMMLEGLSAALSARRHPHWPRAPCLSTICSRTANSVWKTNPQTNNWYLIYLNVAAVTAAGPKLGVGVPSSHTPCLVVRAALKMSSHWRSLRPFPGRMLSPPRRYSIAAGFIPVRLFFDSNLFHIFCKISSRSRRTIE